MQDFTPDQVVGIAKGYCHMARALNEYQTRHWPDLVHEQQLDLNAYQNSLLNRAQDLLGRAARPAFPDTAAMAESIEQAMTDASVGLHQQSYVSVALAVGALTVALAAYVARADRRGIQTALQELEHLLVPDNE